MHGFGLVALYYLGVGRLVLIPAQAGLSQFRHASAMRMKPSVGQLAVGGQYQPFCFGHRLLDSVVYRACVIGLSFLDIRGDISAFILAFFLIHKLQHKGAGQNCLRLKCLQRPVVFHLTRQHALHIALHIHILHLFVVNHVDGEGRYAVFICFQLVARPGHILRL